MSDFLRTLMQRSTAPDAASVRPRVRSRFEPVEGSAAAFAVDPNAGQHVSADEREERPSVTPNVPRAQAPVESSLFAEIPQERRERQGDPGNAPNWPVQPVVQEASDRAIDAADTSGDTTHSAVQSAADSFESDVVWASEKPPSRRVVHEPLIQAQSDERVKDGEKETADHSALLGAEAPRDRSSPRLPARDEGGDISAGYRAGKTTERAMQPLGPIDIGPRAEHAPETEERLPAEPAGTTLATSPRAMADPDTPFVIRPRPADLDAAASSAAPIIRVTIGRVEVRSETPKTVSRTESRPPPPPRQPVLSLGEYLKQRQGGAP